MGEPKNMKGAMSNPGNALGTAQRKKPGVTEQGQSPALTASLLAREAEIRKRYDAVDGYIQAYTAKGGADYDLVSEYDTPSNREKFMKWMDGQEKLDGVPLYRASYVLSGDIVYNIVYGGWKEGETEMDSSYISNNPAGLLAFTRQSSRVFSYGGSMPKRNPKYDRFENEPMHVKFRVDTRGKNFVDIASKSHYPEEQEAVAKNSAKFIYMGAEFHERGQWWEIRLREK